MQSKQFVTRAFILTPGNMSYLLEYYLLSDTTACGDTTYGIMICQNGGESSNQRVFSDNEEDALDMIRLYAEQFVFPCSLDDLIDDYQNSRFEVGL